jgi:hypothetical protein
MYQYYWVEGSPVSMLRTRTETAVVGTFEDDQDDRAEFVEAPGCRNRGARGAITGILLGAGLWGVILVSVGVIKL